MGPRRFNLIYFLLVVTILSTSCIQKTNRENRLLDDLEAKIGHKLILPKEVEVYCLASEEAYNRNDIFSSELKIVTYVDGDCHVCVSDLKKWHQFITENSSIKELKVLFYIHADDFLAFKRLNEIHIHFPFPLFFDQANSFFKKNALSDNKMLQTFLIDNEDNTVLVGNPLFSENLKELYKNEIQKRLK
jgi:hypothetical protein